MAINDTTRPQRPHIRIPVISFYESDFQGIDNNLHDPVVIFVIVEKFIIGKVLVDQGSSVDILPHSTFRKMQLTEVSLHPYNGDLVGFSGGLVNIRGSMWMRTTFDSPPKAKMINVQYLVIDFPNPYHMTLGQPSLNNLGAIISTPQMVLKFPISETEVGVLHAD
ncbi:hypothetical protein Cni_G28856 [Canna indica]|uniref:Uncharacterized protein n=1 Tax=Canna indica TaxID=4628 RepID=A0AAQ3QQN1_9LILI|nr:hypothetical protein Cni_G28856 [Canna indica]